MARRPARGRNHRLTVILASQLAMHGLVSAAGAQVTSVDDPVVWVRFEVRGLLQVGRERVRPTTAFRNSVKADIVAIADSAFPFLSWRPGTSGMFGPPRAERQHASLTVVLVRSQGALQYWYLQFKASRPGSASVAMTSDIAERCGRMLEGDGEYLFDVEAAPDQSHYQNAVRKRVRQIFMGATAVGDSTCLAGTGDDARRAIEDYVTGFVPLSRSVSADPGGGIRIRSFATKTESSLTLGARSLLLLRTGSESDGANARIFEVFERGGGPNSLALGDCAFSSDDKDERLRAWGTNPVADHLGDFIRQRTRESVEARVSGPPQVFSIRRYRPPDGRIFTCRPSGP